MIENKTYLMLSHEFKKCADLFLIFFFTGFALIGIYIGETFSGNFQPITDYLGVILYAPVLETIFYHLPVCWILFKLSKSITLTTLIAVFPFIFLHNPSFQLFCTLIPVSIALPWCFCYYFKNAGILTAVLATIFVHFVYNIFACAVVA